MSLTPNDRRWDVLAQRRQYEELPDLRAQADGWRNGIAAATTFLASVAIVKGRSEFADLAPVWRGITVSVVIAAFAALMTSLLLSVRVAQGRPGEKIWDTGDAFQQWTRSEVVRGGRLLRWAAYLAAVGLLLLVVSMGVGWLAPTAPSTSHSFVLARTTNGTICGRLVSMKGGVLTLQTGPAGSGQTWTAEAASVSDLTPAGGC